MVRAAKLAMVMAFPEQKNERVESFFDRQNSAAFFAWPSPHSIPSTHAERKITVCSHKHSFTPYSTLSPY
jgi:hypothetical protein